MASGNLVVLRTAAGIGSDVEGLVPLQDAHASAVASDAADVVERERREPRRARALVRPRCKIEGAPVREPEPL